MPAFSTSWAQFLPLKVRLWKYNFIISPWPVPRDACSCSLHTHCEELLRYQLHSGPVMSSSKLWYELLSYWILPLWVGDRPTAKTVPSTLDVFTPACSEAQHASWMKPYLSLTAAPCPILLLPVETPSIVKPHAKLTSSRVLLDSLAIVKHYSHWVVTLSSLDCSHLFIHFAWSPAMRIRTLVFPSDALCLSHLGYS